MECMKEGQKTRQNELKYLLYTYEQYADPKGTTKTESGSENRRSLHCHVLFQGSAISIAFFIQV